MACNVVMLEHDAVLHMEVTAAMSFEGVRYGVTHFTHCTGK